MFFFFINPVPSRMACKYMPCPLFSLLIVFIAKQELSCSETRSGKSLQHRYTYQRQSPQCHFTKSIQQSKLPRLVCPNSGGLMGGSALNTPGKRCLHLGIPRKIKQKLETLNWLRLWAAISSIFFPLFLGLLLVFANYFLIQWLTFCRLQECNFQFALAQCP